MEVYMATITVARSKNSRKTAVPMGFSRRGGGGDNAGGRVVLQNEAVTQKEAGRAAHKTLKERIAGFAGNAVDLEKEVDWGKPVGGEIW
jgi:hypothetical protein